MKKISAHTILEWGDYVLSLRMLLGAIAVIAFFMLLLFVLKKLIKSRVSRVSEKADRLLALFQLLKYLIWVLAVILALEQLGIHLTFLLAGSAALLVGLGLGIQQTFNDIISGIIILIEGSLKINDVVEVDKLVGKVTEINLRTSVIYTRDGIYIIVPNHKFINENVINWSHHSRATRFHVSVGVAYGSDELLVKRVLMECLKEEPNVIMDHKEQYPMFVRIVNFGASSVDFELLFWSREIFLIEQIKSNIRFAILEKFREHRIEIPFPQTDIHIKTRRSDA